MRPAGTVLRGLAITSVAAGAALAFLTTAGAASNLQVTLIDCLSHPRKISIQNQGDSAQDLTGWEFRSDQPHEVFDLGVAGTLGAGKSLNVLNGHQSLPEPYYDGNSDTWTYSWNYTEEFDPAAFVLWEDEDYIQIVDAGGKAVSRMLCTGELVAPETPTPPPPTPTPPPETGADPSPTNAPANPQGEAPPSTPAGSIQTLTRSRATEGEQFGPPAQGSEAPLPDSGGRPLSEQSWPLPLIGILAGAALLPGGAWLMVLAYKDPARRD